MESTAASRTELRTEAAALLSRLLPHKNQATLITLSGELGAGKTAFAQEVAQTLGVSEPVTSPTFILAKRYDLTDAPFSRLVHIDAYRLEEGQTLAAAGFDELMHDSANLILLEWPERVSNLPTPDVAITIELLPDGARRIRYA